MDSDYVNQPSMLLRQTYYSTFLTIRRSEIPAHRQPATNHHQQWLIYLTHAAEFAIYLFISFPLVLCRRSTCPLVAYSFLRLRFQPKTFDYTNTIWTVISAETAVIVDEYSSRHIGLDGHFTRNVFARFASCFSRSRNVFL